MYPEGCIPAGVPRLLVVVSPLTACFRGSERTVTSPFLSERSPALWRLLISSRAKVTQFHFTPFFACRLTSCYTFSCSKWDMPGSGPQPLTCCDQCSTWKSVVLTASSLSCSPSCFYTLIKTGQRAWEGFLALWRHRQPT